LVNSNINKKKMGNQGMGGGRGNPFGGGMSEEEKKKARERRQEEQKRR
jgi:hypothetical protein